MPAYSEDFPCWDKFDTVLAIFCSYRYGANASRAVEKHSHKCSWHVTVCIATAYQ